MNETPERIDLRSSDVAEERRRELLRLFPEVGTEHGSVDFDRLRAVLGAAVDAGKERYGLTWPGKSDTFRTIQAPSLGTLLPAPRESVHFDTAGHVIVEGDNLEVLKLLQKSYLGQVKMIYIDPPYNTGRDFIYPDDFSESLQTYLEYTGQADSEGRKFGTNTDSEGRFHSRWLNMMYPRLYFARQLLRDDGFLWVTIDDGEVHNLRSVLGEIFGEENFVANVIWQKKYTRANDARWFSDNHDHVLVFVKNKDVAKLNLLPRSEGQVAAYTNPDRHPKGPWKATPLHAKSGTSRARYVFANGISWQPPLGTFRRYSDASMAEMDVGDEIWFGDDGRSTPSRKSFLSDVKQGVTPVTIWPYEEVGHNHEANSELKRLLGEGVFDNPKPTRLIRRMAELSTSGSSDEIVMDFFAGSGTTAHAILDMNREDGGDRKFILVQLPEPTNRDDYPTIADITKERVRRVVANMDTEDAGKLDLDDHHAQERGFRVFKLAESNFTPWDADAPKNEAALAQQLAMHVDHVRNGRSDLDLLYEILLKSGYPLSTRVETETVAGKTVYSVAAGALLVCLERHLTLDLVRAIADRQPERVVLLDLGFEGNDQLKTNAVQTFKNARGEDAEPIVFRTI